MKKKILVLGASGMIGHMIFKVLSKYERYDVYGTVRMSENYSHLFSNEQISKIRPAVDANNFDMIMRSMAAIQPDIVINCIGMKKQIPFWAKDPLTIINLNSQLPHRISMLCRAVRARFIHLSTDHVFEGLKGSYVEEDVPDATDLYGRTKLLGEVLYPHCITIRTSTIGPEIKSSGYGLLEWFLKQEEKVNGFSKAMFSGLPTCVLAEIIGEYIIPNETLKGLYHISADPISKYDLLNLIAEVYGKKIKIDKVDNVFCDRSLNSNKFKIATGFKSTPWKELIEVMNKYSVDRI